VLKTTFLVGAVIARAISTWLSLEAISGRRVDGRWGGGWRQGGLGGTRVEKGRLGMLEATLLDGTFIPRSVSTKFS
jgi:hypothetical protein